MGELWRSEEMQLVQLFFQLETAYDTMDELGELGLIQFKDMNTGVNQFQRHFANEIKRADELDRKLRFFQAQLDRDAHLLEGDLSFHTHLEFFGDVPLESTYVLDLNELESQFEEFETELHDLNNNIEAMRRNFNELLELEQVLAKGVDFFNQAGEGLGRPEEDLLDDLPDYEASPLRSITQLGFVTGIIAKEKMVSFERVLWRATLGNLFMKHTEADMPLEDPVTGIPEDRIVFIIFYQGQRLREKISKICDSFNANVYPCPETPNERLELLDQVRTRMSDLREVMRRSTEARLKILSKIGPQLEKWKMRLLKEKAIHHSLNMCNFDVGRKCLIAEGWVPKAAIADTHAALKRAQRRSDSPIPSILNVLQTQDEPPTYFRVNKFTSAFQGIVDSYGTARYREVNPGPFTIISFPFLFGVMFGDVGHGGLMFLFALYLVMRERRLASQKLNEMMAYCYHGRYLLLLMSIFSIYCGFIYNEAFAIPMDIFGSRWVYHGDALKASWGNYDTAYLFGVDPAWKGAKNELVYYNSLKMKLSIIFGVTQMMFGIVLSLFNGLYFKKPYNILFEFIPQMIFMLCIFGYLCLLIIVKWCTDFAHSDKPAPYLLNIMIDMFLRPFSLPEENQLYPGQLGFQIFFLILALLSVPCMLLPKPFLLRRDHKRRLATTTRVLPLLDEDRVDFSEDVTDIDETEEFDFGEVFIHQVIHTIEFVLGGISNTASYLRLWALSLAHSELATVFWERIMVAGFEYGRYSALIPFFAFGAWAALTIGILLSMEGLSAFLHALRLHWVEFQNKFYAGDGRKFIPFSFKAIAENDEEEFS